MKEVELKKYETDHRGMTRPTAISDKSAHSKFRRMDTKKHLFLEDCTKCRKINIDTFRKELKSVLLKKNEFENQDESTLPEYKNFW